jgi:hypothetical protein
MSCWLACQQSFAASTMPMTPETGVLPMTAPGHVKSATSDHPCHNGSAARPEVLTAMGGNPVSPNPVGGNLGGVGEL